MRLKVRTLSALCMAATSLVLLSRPPSLAQKNVELAAHRDRPIRFVIPFTPGGQPHIVSRLIQPRLAEPLGQQIVVDNRPGAGGLIGGRIVAGAAPDG